MTPRNILPFIFLCIVCISCKKDDSSVDTVVFYGLVKDSITLKGIGNVLIKSTWYNRSANQEIAVDSTVTLADGSYKMITAIDHEMFKTHLLNINARVPANYISPLDVAHADVGMSLLGIQSESPGLPILYMYPRADLSIHLKKTSPDPISQFEFRYNFQGPDFRNYFLLTGSSVPADSTFIVRTAAGLATNINWRRVDSRGTETKFQTSLTCVPGSGNSIQVTY
ncbi:MAG: hypothetical protein Q7T76_03010 [Ferruginibacter sp.]|nr:hypothetical protein [Ferruginibacter sp.]